MLFRSRLVSAMNLFSHYCQFFVCDCLSLYALATLAATARKNELIKMISTGFDRVTDTMTRSGDRLTMLMMLMMMHRDNIHGAVPGWELQGLARRAVRLQGCGGAVPPPVLVAARYFRFV